jgi:hypothetical protein
MEALRVYGNIILKWILMYVPCIVYNLLFRPTNTQYINSNVYFVKYFNIFFILIPCFIDYVEINQQN